MPLKVVELTDDIWRKSLGKATSLLEGDILMAGVAVIKVGQRFPAKGFSTHPESDELSYVISGEVRFCTDKEEITLRKGHLLLNPKGTPHYVENIGKEDSKVLWILAPKIEL